jgi:DNA (cytosine-5)-methyltransferase 1
MDAAPVWSDVCTFDAAAWRGRVDCIVAGFPCQDLSVAGRRAGLDGKRSGLFFEVVRIATDGGAWLMFLENVAGIATATASVVDAAEGELDERAAARVVGELADLGWDAEWLTLAASDVGASHGRARWFCLAWRAVADANHDGRERGRVPAAEGRVQPVDPGWPSCSVGDADSAGLGAGWGVGDDRTRQARRVAEPSSHHAMADTNRPERPGSGLVSKAGWPESGVACSALADAECSSCERRREPGDMARARSEAEREGHQRQRGGPAADGRGGAMANAGEPRLPQPECGELRGSRGWSEGRAAEQLRGAPLLFAPGPTDPRWLAILAEHPHLAPAIEPAFRGVVDGLAFDMGDSRAARLKCVGNGVVALQAAAAFVVLARRAGLPMFRDEVAA